MSRPIVSSLVLLAFLGACSAETDTSTATPATVAVKSELTPEQLGELGAAIRKNPNEATRLLSEKGLNEESFESAVRKVAESPDASKRYAAAYKRASAT